MADTADAGEELLNLSRGDGDDAVSEAATEIYRPGEYL